MLKFTNSTSLNILRTTKTMCQKPQPKATNMDLTNMTLSPGQVYPNIGHFKWENKLLLTMYSKNYLQDAHAKQSLTLIFPYTCNLQIYSQCFYYLYLFVIVVVLYSLFMVLVNISSHSPYLAIYMHNLLSTWKSQWIHPCSSSFSLDATLVYLLALLSKLKPQWPSPIHDPLALVPLLEKK